MKSKIEQYAKGNFVYEHPEIILSENEITFVVEAGRTYTGTFTITNDKKTLIKGVLYSLNQHIKIQERQFIGSENLIHYEIDARNLEAGEGIDGTIDIVSDCGEASISCKGQVVAPSLNTAVGPMKGLNQFADYAKNDWEGAKKLFQEKEFVNSPLLADSDCKELYYSLIKGSNLSGAFEEFLIAIHRKRPIRFQVSADSFHYETVNEIFSEELVITKDLWGYAELEVSTDAEFIELDRTSLSTDDFIGNQYSLEFKINPHKLARGSNVGHLYVETLLQTFVIGVGCNQARSLTQEMINHRKVKEYKTKLMKLYLEFRLKNIHLDQYVSESGELVNSCLAMEPSDEMQLFRIHLAMIGHEEAMADQMLSAYEKKLEELREIAPVLYCGVYYLRALQYKDEATIQMACDIIREVYDEGHHEFMIFWFLIYLDKYYLGQRKILLEDLQQKFEEGCTSPMLYYEAANIYLQEPGLLHGLGKFEAQVMKFVLKHELFNEEIANHYAYLAVKSKHYSRLVYKTLEKLYEQFETKDILTAICSMLIKGHLKVNKYFKWFKQGVEAQLRVTELHEYYMYAIDEYSDEELPQQILLYFIYNSSLNDKKRAYLYARIVRNKESNGSIYRTYAKKIEQFAIRQLESGAVNENLAILYQNLVDEGQVTEVMYPFIARIAYKAEVNCSNPTIKGVVVSCLEVEGEEYVPLQEGIALVTLKTPNARIYLVDEKNERHFGTIEYQVKYILRQDELLRRIMQWSRESLYQQIDLLVGEGAYRGFNEDGIRLSKQCLDLKELREEYRNKICEQMIYYYQEHQQFDALEYYLRELNLNLLNTKSRSRILELCITQESFDLALQIIEQFGFEHLSIGKLLRLYTRCVEPMGQQAQEVAISHGQISDNQGQASFPMDTIGMFNGQAETVFPQTSKVSEQFIYQVAVYLFQNGRRDKQVLELLSKQYEGPNHIGYRIWNSAVKDDITAHSLEEEMLIQAMFAREDLHQRENVFLSYYHYAPKSKVTKAYLNLVAFEYLMKDKKFSPEIMGCMKQELTISENNLCMVAVLKHASERLDDLSEEEIGLIGHLLDQAAAKNLILKEYQKFAARIELPDGLKNKQYAGYRANPEHRVSLSYRILDGSAEKKEFTTELLGPCIQGIFTRSFLVFYGETVEYYFTEETGSETIKTEVERITCNLEETSHLTNYTRLNVMLQLFEQKKNDELSDEMEQYVKNEYIMNHYFKNL